MLRIGLLSIFCLAMAGCSDDSAASDEGPGSCRGSADICTGGCTAGYGKVELAPDCCACKPDHCDVDACPEPQCDGSSLLSLPNDSCCPACFSEDTCEEGDTPCAAFQCATGYKARVTSGPCCDHCEADPEYCAPEKAAYLTALEGFLDAEATACDTDADCTRLRAFNRCHVACFGPGVNKTKSSEVAQNIETYVEEHCSHCPLVNLICGAVALLPVCREGACE